MPEPGLKPDPARGCCPPEAASASSCLVLPFSLPLPSSCLSLAAKAAGGTKGLARGSGLAEPDDSDLDKPLSLCWRPFGPAGWPSACLSTGTKHASGLLVVFVGAGGRGGAGGQHRGVQPLCRCAQTTQMVCYMASSNNVSYCHGIRQHTCCRATEQIPQTLEGTLPSDHCVAHNSALNSSAEGCLAFFMEYCLQHCHICLTFACHSTCGQGQKYCCTAACRATEQ